MGLRDELPYHNSVKVPQSCLLSLKAYEGLHGGDEAFQEP